MSKSKRTALGWSETSSGTYHLRVEIAGKATRRVVACGAQVEKNSEILTNEEMVKAARINGNHICRSCIDSPLLAPPSVKWGKGGFIGDNSHGDTILRYDDLGIYVRVNLRQLKKLHEKLGEFLSLMAPAQTATVTITTLAIRGGTQDIIQAIKCLRDHLGLSLKDAADRVRGLPVPFAVFTGNKTKAEALTQALESCGYGVELRDEP